MVKICLEIARIFPRKSSYLWSILKLLDGVDWFYSFQFVEGKRTFSSINDVMSIEDARNSHVDEMMCNAKANSHQPVNDMKYEQKNNFTIVNSSSHSTRVEIGKITNS